MPSRSRPAGNAAGGCASSPASRRRQSLSGFSGTLVATVSRLIRRIRVARHRRRIGWSDCRCTARCSRPPRLEAWVLTCGLGCRHFRRECEDLGTLAPQGSGPIRLNDARDRADLPGSTAACHPTGKFEAHIGPLILPIYQSRLTDLSLNYRFSNRPRSSMPEATGSCCVKYLCNESL